MPFSFVKINAQAFPVIVFKNPRFVLTAGVAGARCRVEEALAVARMESRSSLLELGSRLDPRILIFGEEHANIISRLFTFKWKNRIPFKMPPYQESSVAKIRVCWGS